MNYLYVSLGGVLGASARYFIFSLMELRSLNFPYHTILVNILGCLLIGFIVEFFALRSHLPYNVKLFLVTGFIGSFTTFSTFVVDAGLLIERNEIIKSVFYMTLSTTLGVLSYFAAVYITRLLLAPTH